MKRILSLLASVALVFTLTAASAPQPAQTTAAPATGLDDSYVIIYESNGQSGDHHKLFKSDAPRSVQTFQTYSVDLFLGCDNRNNNWTNCISSLYVHVKAGSCVKFYDGDNYAGTLLQLIYQPLNAGAYEAGNYNWGGTTKDNRASSMRWGDWTQTGPTDFICEFGSYE